MVILSPWSSRARVTCVLSRALDSRRNSSRLVGHWLAFMCFALCYAKKYFVNGQDERFAPLTNNFILRLSQLCRVLLVVCFGIPATSNCNIVLGVSACWLRHKNDEPLQDNFQIVPLLSGFNPPPVLPFHREEAHTGFEFSVSFLLLIAL